MAKGIDTQFCVVFLNKTLLTVTLTVHVPLSTGVQMGNGELNAWG